MYPASHFAKCVWVTVGLLLGLSSGQNRIVFRDEDAAELGGRNLVTSIKIPERLLIQLKDVQNVTELISRFIVTEDSGQIEGNETVNVNSRRAKVPGVPVIAQAANCQPEPEVVELRKPRNGAIILWPSCVRVRRCGGCCTSKMLKCSPIATSFYNVTVLQLLYNPQVPNAFESQGSRVIALEQHDRCVCKCRQQADSCGDLQEYREDECRCVCINKEQAAQCTGPKRIWDSSECACKCRRVMDCSTGSYFNPVECKCEATKRSLAVNNLDNQNSSISDRSGAQDIHT